MLPPPRVRTRLEGHTVVRGGRDEAAAAEPRTQHLYEPFFTTKRTGTGLGLAIRQQGDQGRTEGPSPRRPGLTGTLFRIVLPQGLTDVRVPPSPRVAREDDALTKPVVLVVDDEKTFRMVAETALTAEGYEVPPRRVDGRRCRASPSTHPIWWSSTATREHRRPAARTRFAQPQNDPEVPASGEERAPVGRAAAGDHGRPCGEIEHAVQAPGSGPTTMLTKPLSLPELIHKVGAALAEPPPAPARSSSLASRAGERAQRRLLTSDNAAMRQVDALISAVAKSPTTTVLIEGESGTGKQLVAQLIHERTTTRRGEPFVEIGRRLAPRGFGGERGLRSREAPSPTRGC